MEPKPHGRGRRDATAAVRRLLRPGKPRLLIVEDILPIRELFARAFEGRGYEVHGAADGVEGLAQARRLRPDLVLMNFVMPRMNGYEALRALKGDPVISYLKVVAYSSAADPRFRELFLSAGADAFVRTPCELESLLDMAGRVIARRPRGGGS